MDYTIPENLGKELDKLLTPILGNHFQIERNHHGVYFIHASSGHVFTIHGNESEKRHEHKDSNRKIG